MVNHIKFSTPKNMSYLCFMWFMKLTYSKDRYKISNQRNFFFLHQFHYDIVEKIDHQITDEYHQIISRNFWLFKGTKKYKSNIDKVQNEYKTSTSLWDMTWKKMAISCFEKTWLWRKKKIFMLKYILRWPSYVQL